ncbi:MAG: universal stress protein [Candidatus Hodarchaeales archaeon]
MTDQERFEEISRQFKRSVKPKLVIEKIKAIKRIIVAMDDTSKSIICMKLGIKLSQKWNAHTKFLRTQRYGAHLLDYIHSTELASEMGLEEVRKEIGDEPGFKAEIHNISGVPPPVAFELIENALKESGGAIGLLTTEIEAFKPDFVIAPVPLAENKETGEVLGEDSLGTALDLVLRRTSRDIPILLVEGETLKIAWKTILCVFTPEQHAESVKITLAHALRLASSGSTLILLGVIDPSLVDTFAGVFSEVQKEEVDPEKARGGLKLHVEHLLYSVDLNIEEKVTIKRKIRFGRADEVLKEVIAEMEPDLVVYQSKYLPHDPLDSMADEIARHMREIPVLIVWEE